MESQLEQVLINSYKDGMISFMHKHPECFDEAFELAISDKERLSWRAAWLLWSCLKENDEKIKPRVEEIINVIDNKNDNHQRELLKILLLIDLDEKHESYLFNLCMNIWEQIGKQPSVRFIAFKFITKIVKKYPELSKEIIFLTEDHYMETLSPGVRKSVLKMMRGISK